MNTDLVTTIEQEIDSSVGDTSRLEFILGKIKTGTPLYECDRRYLKNRLLEGAQERTNSFEHDQEQAAQRSSPRLETDQVYSHEDRAKSVSTGRRNLATGQSDGDSERVIRQTKTVEQMRSELHRMSVKLDHLEETIQEKKYRERTVPVRYGDDSMSLSTQNKTHIELKPDKTLETSKDIAGKPILRVFAKALLVSTLATIAALFVIFAVFNISITRTWLEDYGTAYDQIKTVLNWMLPILVIILANWSLCAYMFLAKTRKSK